MKQDIQIVGHATMCDYLLYLQRPETAHLINLITIPISILDSVQSNCTETTNAEVS